jgi:hypothetical protein
MVDNHLVQYLVMMSISKPVDDPELLQRKYENEQMNILVNLMRNIKKYEE